MCHPRFIDVPFNFQVDHKGRSRLHARTSEIHLFRTMATQQHPEHADDEQTALLRVDGDPKESTLPMRTLATLSLLRVIDGQLQVRRD